MRTLVPAVMLLVMVSASAFTQEGQQEVISASSPRIEKTYNSATNKTTVRLAPVQISGAKDKYIRLHMSLTYPGQPPFRPEIIDFELQTVVKGQLSTDLYAVFIIDRETVFLSSRRRGIKRPVPGRVWLGESLVFRMPYETLMKLAHAKQAAVKMGGVVFDFDETHKSLLKMFAQEIDVQRG